MPKEITLGSQIKLAYLSGEDMAAYYAAGGTLGGAEADNILLKSFRSFCRFNKKRTRKGRLSGGLFAPLPKRNTGLNAALFCLHRGKAVGGDAAPVRGKARVFDGLAAQ